MAIADALVIEPVKLLPGAFTTRRRELRDTVIGTAPDSVTAIKSAMLRCNGAARILGVPDQRPVEHTTLTTRINKAFVLSQTERWSRLGLLLPDLIVTPTDRRSPRRVHQRRLLRKSQQCCTLLG